MQNMPADAMVHRRKFLSDSARLLVMISSFSTLACACAGDQEEDPRLADLMIKKGRLVLDLGKSRFQALNTIGNGLKLEITRQEKPLIITRISATQVAAFSSQCTHAGYEVLLPEQGVLACSSGHGGAFDLEGRVLSGPARSDLSRYPAQLIDNRVFITYSLP
jgi:Rieske Fe-S protein